MSIQVNDFQWEPGKNDAEYIKLLESSRDEWQKIAQKAIAKLKALSKAQEPRVDGKSQEVISGFTQYCPNCGFANTCWGTISPRENTVFYCEKCGIEVKWE